METFTELKDFIHNPHYKEQRQKALNMFDITSIDSPIIDLIYGYIRLPYCFTLQSCSGHFLYKNQEDQKNTEPLPILNSNFPVEYRIAYVAFCIQNSELGKILFQDLRKVPGIDPEYIQFGCAEWFWQRQLNSFVLQVEPEKYKMKDKVRVSLKEALHIEKVRNDFFKIMKKIILERVR